jgi:tetratricopeptide (TPR) repeat protein
MKKHHLLYLAIFAATSLYSCSKFTDIRTEGALTPGEYLNFRYLMNNQDLKRSVDMSDYSADDTEYTDSAMQKSLSPEYLRGYMWADQYYDAITADPDWKISYASTYTCNLVIRDVMGSAGGTVQEKNQVIAEARVHRAYNYFMLVNEYGKQYDAATSSKDLGVPLMLKPDVAEVAVRGTVQEAYDQIISDLTQAIPSLPDKNNYNIYPSKAAAYALLARTYLQMGRFAEAGEYADKALTIQNTLLDLPNSTVPRHIYDPEIILVKEAGTSHTYSNLLVLSKELKALYQPTDIRYTKLTQDYTYSGKVFRVNASEMVNYETRNVGVTVPEMMLIKAETLARAGKANEAMAIINTLRKKRFSAADYSELAASTADEALIKVLEERRRELAFKSIRWFDQKRLAAEPRFAKPITRTNLVSGASYTLAPNSNRYIYPIPAYNIQLNPALEQNPR